MDFIPLGSPTELSSKISAQTIHVPTNAGALGLKTNTMVYVIKSTFSVIKL